MLVWGCAALTVAWCVTLVTAPSWPGEASGPLYALGSLICHQRPERSFHAAAGQLPVCARCLGVYAGAAIGACAAGAASGLRWLVPAGTAAVARDRAAILLTACALPAAVTLVWEWVGLGSTSNTLRAITGVLLGAGVGLTVVIALRADATRRSLIH
jgi:uncharacterized membrane protein